MEKEQKYRSGKNLNEKGPHIKEVVNFPLPPPKSPQMSTFPRPPFSKRQWQKAISIFIHGKPTQIALFDIFHLHRNESA